MQIQSTLLSGVHDEVELHVYLLHEEHLHSVRLVDVNDSPELPLHQVHEVRDVLHPCELPPAHHHVEQDVDVLRLRDLLLLLQLLVLSLLLALRELDDVCLVEALLVDLEEVLDEQLAFLDLDVEELDVFFAA